MLVLFAFLLGLNFFHSLFPAFAKDSLKDMNLNSLTEKTFVEEKPKFFSISGYLESRNQLKTKKMDETCLPQTAFVAGLLPGPGYDQGICKRLL